MALLDFRCRDCGENFFEIVRTGDRNKLLCPKCKSKNIEQVFEGSSSFGTGKSNSRPIRTGG